jgi:AAA domain, putative AbiEii toxin, Type IV TA system
MIDTDTSLVDHYQRVVGLLLPILSNLDGAEADDLKQARETIAPVAGALAALFPNLAYTSLGNPTEDGSFYFTRDGQREFRFENLSGGEKTAFDLLLDVHLAKLAIGDPVIALDEPELHINPAIQADLLDSLLALAGEKSQLWIATHSPGMLRRAFELAKTAPDSVAFLDFTDVEGPAPDIELKPVELSRRLLQRAMTVALVSCVRGS